MEVDVICLHMFTVFRKMKFFIESYEITKLILFMTLTANVLILFTPRSLERIVRKEKLYIIQK